jgi:translation initiation factor IF-3
VKVTIMFRGRETVHPENGERLLLRLADDVSELAKIETPPKLDGRNMTMSLIPYKEAVVSKPKTEPKPRAPRRQPAPEPEPETDTQKPVKVTRAEGG